VTSGPRAIARPSPGRAHGQDQARPWPAPPAVSARTRRFLVGGALVVLSLYLLETVLPDWISPAAPRVLLVALSIVAIVLRLNHIVTGNRTQQR
jgi:hypothetical protein